MINEFLKEEYGQKVIDDLKVLPIEDKIYKRKIETIKKNVDEIRANYIAHGLLNPEEGAIVDLNDIKELHRNGCELFQHLSFKVNDFYNPLLEGNGTGKLGLPIKNMTRDNISSHFGPRPSPGGIGVRLDGKLVNPEKGWLMIPKKRNIK